jgi:hypothetical protein
MNCLRSFVITTKNTATFSPTQIKTWAVGAQHFWAGRIAGLSVFDVQGFKNVDIYGVDVIGAVITDLSAGALSGGVVVEDWGFEIVLGGQLPLVSGVVQTSPSNFWNLQTAGTSAQTFSISKNTNSIKFADPINSVKFINFEALLVQGSGAQTLGSVALDYDISFIVYYKYEGE